MKLSRKYQGNDQAKAQNRALSGRRTASRSRAARRGRPLRSCRIGKTDAEFGSVPDVNRPHAKKIMGDIKNYSDIAPVMQISEVVVG